MGIQSHLFGQGSKALVARVADRKASTKEPEAINVDHVFCIDVSGSMSGELPKLREHLKNKIVKMVQPGDTLSLVWFSGRGQHGTLLTEQAIKGLLDVKEVHDLIDRFLHPVGMTGFKEPLEDCGKVWAELRKSRPNALSSLLFMSDGCDNQWSREEILGALDKIYGKFQASTFVEYGYYADRKLLTAMAEKMGGSVVLSEDFPSFAPVVEKALCSYPNRAFAKIEAPGCKDFAFAIASNGDLLTFAVENGQVTVPVDPDTKEVVFDLYWLSDSIVGTQGSALHTEDYDYETVMKGAYAALSAYGHRMRGDIVKPLLLDVRDPSLLHKFSTCFGKQRYSEFAADALKPLVRARVEPEAVKKYFRTDLPTMVDLFEILMDVDALVLLDDAKFKYTRISRKTTSVDGSLKFKADEQSGYPITNLTLNECRANISMLIQKWGKIDLDVPGKPEGLPKELRAFQYRNFTLVADGIVHVDLLVVRLTTDGYIKFKNSRLYPMFDEMGLVRGVAAHDQWFDLTLDLTRVGLTNEQMTTQPSGKMLLEKELELLKWRAEQKVLKYYSKLHDKVEVDASMAIAFGDAEAAWLKEKGLLKGGLFQPKTEKADATDVYKGVELQTSIKSFNSLPKIEEILERKKTGKKLTPSMELLLPIVERCEDAAQKMKTKEFESFIDTSMRYAVARTRHLIAEVARQKYAILLGQTWFSEAKTPGELVLTAVYDGRSYECTVKLVDVDIEV